MTTANGAWRVIGYDGDAMRWELVSCHRGEREGRVAYGEAKALVMITLALVSGASVEVIETTAPFAGQTLAALPEFGRVARGV